MSSSPHITQHGSPSMSTLTITPKDAPPGSPGPIGEKRTGLRLNMIPDSNPGMPLGRVPRKRTRRGRRLWQRMGPVRNHPLGLAWRLLRLGGRPTPDRGSNPGGSRLPTVPSDGLPTSSTWPCGLSRQGRASTAASGYAGGLTPKARSIETERCPGRGGDKATFPGGKGQMWSGILSRPASDLLATGSIATTLLRNRGSEAWATRAQPSPAPARRSRGGQLTPLSQAP